MITISYIVNYVKTNENRLARFLFYLIFATALFYFFIRTVYFALNINPNIPPDETTHYGRIIAFSKVLFIPHDSPETYELGLIAHEPYLYYLLFAKLMNLNIFGMSNLIFLRLINAITGLGIILIACAWFHMITEKWLPQLLFVIVSTNTLMFTFLCGSVNYDNLTNLFAIASIYFLFRFLRYRSVESFLITLIFTLAGILTKVTFIPIALIVSAILIVHERAHLGRISLEIKKTFRAPSVSTVLYVALLLILSIGSINLYGVNLIKYRKIVPDYDQVLTHEQALQYRIFARNKIYDMFLTGKMTYNEALHATSIIHNRIDSISAVILIQNAQYRKINGTAQIDRITYTPLWAQYCLERMLGILGFLSMYKTGYALSFYFIIFLFAFLLFVRKWRGSDSNGLMGLTVIIAFLYILFLMQFICYSFYIYFGDPGAELQGKYVFPVLPLLYGIVSYYVLSFRSKIIQIIIFCAISCIFINGDLPYFLSHAYAAWFIH